MLTHIIAKAIEIGRKERAIEMMKESAFISQTQAEKFVGSGATLKRWKEQGLIEGIRDFNTGKRSNTKIRYNVLDLMAVVMNKNMLKDISPKAKAELQEMYGEII